MQERYENAEKRSTAINACLDQFVHKGLFGTTSRDLSKALNLQSAGMYSYFENKDDAVIACAQQAADRLERDLFEIAMECVKKEKICFTPVKEAAKRLSPMMRFFTQVCSTDKYEFEMRRVLHSLNNSYISYVTKLADLLNVSADELKPTVYIGITAIVNYMVYQEDMFIDPLLSIVEKELQLLK